MAKKKTFESELKEYKSKYDLETISNPNDISNLETMIRNQLLMEQLQTSLENMATDPEKISSVSDIKKVLDSIVALSSVNIQIEKTLGIDRKTRQQDEAASTVDYINFLKSAGKEFLDKRLTKVYCKDCNIMVGRISGVYDTTAFYSEFQCPQCKKTVIAKRQEKDIFFDIKPGDRDWRRKYPIEIEQPKRNKIAEQNNADNDFIIGNQYDDIQFDSEE